MLRILLMSTILIVSLQALPKEIEADKYLLLAKQNMKDKNYQEAQDNFEKILSLGVKIPNTLHYYYAKTLYENREFDKTLSELDIFLTNGGKEDKHYVEALKLYTDAENEIANRNKYVVKDGSLLFLPLKAYIHKDLFMMNWKKAKSYCENLNLLGKGWRLPTIVELKQMTNDDVLNTINMTPNEIKTLYKNWKKKHDLERIKGPDCVDMKKKWWDNQECYSHVKEKFTKNIKSEYDILNFHAAIHQGIWTNELSTSNGQAAAKVINFDHNVIYLEPLEIVDNNVEYSTSKNVVCVKEK